MPVLVYLYSDQVLIHGSKEATHSLAKYCQANSVCLGEVFSPAIGETVDTTTERHIYQVRLIDSLISQLQFAKTHSAETELAWIDSQVPIYLLQLDSQSASCTLSA